MTDHVVTPEAFASHGFAAKYPLDELTTSTDLSACLMPLLRAMQWRGTNRQIAEALPHFTEELDITGFLNVMANLHFGCRQVRTRLDRIDERLMPCLFVPRHGPAMVLVRPSGLDVRAFDPELGMETNLEAGDWEGTAYLFNRLEQETTDRRAGKATWFTTIVGRFRRVLYQMLGLTLVLNLFALATPLFVMAVYDRVIATGSLTTLAYFGIGVVIALACDLLLRFVRASALMYVGARLDNILGNAVFQRILFLPPAMLEHATIGAQVSRIKDFETVRDFFTGPMALVFLELPFVVVFIVVIAFLGGPIAFVPLAMLALMALMALLGFIVAPMVRAAVTEATRSGSKRQGFIVETLSTLRTLKFCAAEGAWLDRFRDLSARAAMGSFRIAQYTALINTLSHVLMIAAGTATIAFGVFRVFEGEMTVGALVASMILVWRVLAPLQTGLVTLGRLTQVRSSIGQINNLMTMKPEGAADRASVSNRRVEGRVAFSRVSMRYSAAADPALVGVSFTVEPGEVVSVIGGNGSGKSTMIKLMLGIYMPQAGSIRVGRRDVRQFDPIELRRTIAYVPQEAEFFCGTIAQNLRLADPVASDEDLRWAVDQAGILEDVLALEEGSGKWRRTGFEVRVGDARTWQLLGSLLQGLNLARGYLKRAPVLLLDEPGVGLDTSGDKKLMETIESLRGNTTVFLVTHRPSHRRLADKTVWLDGGHLRAFGPSADVEKLIPSDFS